MNRTVIQPSGGAFSKRVSRFGTIGSYGFAGIVVQVLMMYIISRDLLMSSSFLNYYYLYVLVVSAPTLACYWQTGRPEEAAASRRGECPPAYPQGDTGMVLPR